MGEEEGARGNPTPIVPLRTALSQRSSDRAARLFHKLVAQEISPHKREKRFNFAFNLKETTVSRIHDEIKRAFAAGPIPDVTIEFVGLARFIDLTSVKFDDFSAFLLESGASEEPEAISLKWEQFAISDDGDPLATGVELAFVTERNLEGAEEPGQLHRASMSLSVSGSNETWVTSLFSKLGNTLNGLSYSPPESWFNIFRNPWLIMIFSHTLGWTGFIFGSQIAGIWQTNRHHDSTAETLKQILAATSSEQKLDLLSKAILSPESSPWWYPISILFGGALSYVVIYLACQPLLPRLAPISIIGIGSAGEKSEKRLQTWRFAVITVLFCGFVLTFTMGKITRLIAYLLSL